MSAEAHPGRSMEFLSRLHDGELSAAERARFESHRAHCAECRHAAAEFEAALSMYRSAPTSPASPDLAARILRRLQTATPRRRRPFGIFYGIDLRWASAFAAALVAMIIGSSVVLRREAARPVPTRATPIPVQLQKEEPAREMANAPETLALPRDRSSADAAASRRNEVRPESKAVLDQVNTIGAAKTESEKQKVAAQAPAAPAAAPPVAVAEPGGSKERDASARGAAAAAPPPAVSGRLASRDDPSGGEHSTAAAQELAFAEEKAPVRLEVTALDGEGRPPATLVPPELGAEHRGRAFVVVVSASGQVLEAFPHAETARRREQEESANAKRQKLDKDEVPEGLTRMRFEAGSGPRRLLVTVR